MNASILLYRSATLVSQGDWESAIAAAEAVRIVSRRSRMRMQNRTCRAQTAYARWQLARDPDAAETLAKIAGQFLEPNNSQQYVSMVFGWVVEVMVDRGDREPARFFMAQIIRRVREGGDRLGEAMGWRAMARAAQREGDDARADRYLSFARRSAAIRLLKREQAHDWVCAARLLRARGRAQAADALLEQAARAFEAMDVPSFRASGLAFTSR